jgi:hypothetical protein
MLKKYMYHGIMRKVRKWIVMAMIVQQCEFIKCHLTVHFKIVKMSQALVTHAYNPTYSGGRDQKELSLRASLGK